jgi:hypothetical protein
VPETVFYLSGHADDALLFRGEGLFTDMHTQDVKTVQIVLSAGDAGRTDGWWQARETACVESMAGALTAGPVAEARVTVNGHRVQRYTAPTWVLYALRLPDGGLDGNGFAATGFRTMTKLRAGTIPSLAAVDGSATYSGWADLVATLRAIVAAQRGTTVHPWVNAADQDRGLSPDDHPDHYAGSEALLQFAAAVGLNRLWWVSYDIRNRPANLAGYALDIKRFPFQLYGWALDDLTATLPNEQEWAWWGARSYAREEIAG